jgi:hypothetical protein
VLGNFWGRNDMAGRFPAASWCAEEFLGKK